MPRKSKTNVVTPEPIVEENKQEAPVIAEVEKKSRKSRKPKVEPALVVVDEPKTVTVKKARKTNPWILHCSKVKAENPGVSYREILKIAKTSYVKKGSKPE